MMRIELDNRYMKNGVTRGMITWQKEAKAICRKRTHAMKTSIGYIVESFRDGFKGIIGTFANKLRKAKNFHYPFSVHDGITRSYTVVPRSAKALHFTAGGKDIFAKKVTIKPRKGYPFFDISYRTKESQIDKHILDGVRLK